MANARQRQIQDQLIQISQIKIVKQLDRFLREVDLQAYGVPLEQTQT